MTGTEFNRRCRRSLPAASRAMTLIELVAVLALMSLLITMGTLAFHAWTRSGGVRTAQNQVLAGVSGARQLALTHRAYGRFSAVNLDGRGAFSLYVITNAHDHAGTYVEMPVGQTNHLPRGIIFVDGSLDQEVDAEQSLDLHFRPDGGGFGGDDYWPQYRRLIVIAEAGRPGAMQATVVVHRLTGHVGLETGQ